MHGYSAFIGRKTDEHQRLFGVAMIAGRVRRMRDGPEDHVHSKAFFKAFWQVLVDRLSELRDRSFAIIGQAVNESLNVIRRSHMCLFLFVFSKRRNNVFPRRRKRLCSLFPPSGKASLFRKVPKTIGGSAAALSPIDL